MRGEGGMHSGCGSRVNHAWEVLQLATKIRTGLDARNWGEPFARVPTSIHSSRTR